MGRISIPASTLTLINDCKVGMGVITRRYRKMKAYTKRRRSKGGSQTDTSAVCAIMKYEDKYVEEWIQYYLYGLGFTNICIYDNSEENTLNSIENKYKGVEIIHYPGKIKQLPAYNDWLRRNAARPETERIRWCAFFDADEFLVLKKHATITDFLKDHCKDGAVCINWMNIGDNNLEEYSPEPVTERFVRRSSTVNQHIKSIVNCDDVVSITEFHGIGNFKPGTYNKDTTGKRVDGPFNPGGPTDIAVVNHYIIKTREGHTHKKNRGRANTNNSKFLRTNASFNENVKNSNEVLDESAKYIYATAKEKMASQTGGTYESELVIARVAEDLKWIPHLPFQHIRVYNKGTDLISPYENTQVINLPNLGREAHTYLHHIIENYENLADMTLFLPGSVRSKPFKSEQLDKIMASLKSAPMKSVIVENKGLNKNAEKGFTITNHVISNNGNRALNPRSNLNAANTNPLGQWFAKYLPNEEMRCMSTNGIFAASREDIRKRTLEEYKMLIKTVSTENPVAVHYLERVWANVVSIDHCI